MVNLLEKLKEIGAIKEGDFVLKGGATSTVYFDKESIWKSDCL